LVVLAISALEQAALYVVLAGRDGAPCGVWANPSDNRLAEAIHRTPPGGLAGLRGLLTQSDLYIWQSVNLLHSDFERDTGLQGVRLALRSAEVLVNDETVALPEHFPWVFTEGAEIASADIEDRRTTVAERLQGNARLQAIYPCGFTVGWYC
jgi:hypothetical protein